MRKLKFFLAAFFVFVCAAVCGAFANANFLVADAAGEQYYLGGIAAGFTLSQGGTEIIGFNDVATENGVRRPAEEAGMRVGDCIVAVDGICVTSIAELNAALERSEGKTVKVTVKRKGETAEASVTPAKDVNSGKYKIGVLIRDTLSGIGTVTYINKQTLRFGSLGHAVSDTPLGVADSKVYLCSVVGVNKGVRGKAGELRGLFINEKPIATADKVCGQGLYGSFSSDYDFSALQVVEAAPASQAKIGKACIYSTIDGVTPVPYDIDLVKVDEGQKDNKNFVIKITDERLISETGGIVQGMSGSPIVQNGKLIGAVTHVFLNDPTRGYGIAIDKMLQN